MKNNTMAFPICDASNMHPIFDKDNNLIGHTVINMHSGGMPLRDYFAAKAMQAFISNSDLKNGIAIDGVFKPIQEASYIVADAMLLEREK